MSKAKAAKVQKLKVEKGVNYAKAPFPYFGGKSGAAAAVWQALGDVNHYVEPFLGSAAVLSARPHEVNRTYYSETVNDLNLYLCNFWRALAADPDRVAEAASWPVSETDLFSRHMALVRWGTDPEVRNRMQADPLAYDTRMAGWWVWGLSSWIGSGWCTGTGPWHVNAEGLVEKQASRRAREPVVTSGLPVLTNDRGVNHPMVREPGVASQVPHLFDDGKGVNRPQLREPGVDSQLPMISNDGKGVNHASLREMADKLTMPKLREWLRFLASRLRHVRILCGEWERALTDSAVRSLSCRKGGGVAGVFLDPPYGAEAERYEDVYAHDDLGIAPRVREWCRLNGDNPGVRIVLAGFEGEHNELETMGWRKVEWFKGGFLKGGMGNTAGSGQHQQGKERLWLSPHCIDVGAAPPSGVEVAQDVDEGCGPEDDDDAS